MQLFTNAGVDGVSTAYKHYYPNHEIALYLSGVFGGGTVTLEAYVPDRSVWVAVESKTYTGAGMYIFTLPPCIVRLSLAGATAPTLNAWVESYTISLRDDIRNTTV